MNFFSEVSWGGFERGFNKNITILIISTSKKEGIYFSLKIIEGRVEIFLSPYTIVKYSKIKN